MLFRPYRSPNWKAHNATAANTSNAIADFLPGYVLRDWSCMALRTLALLAIGTRVANAPDGVRAVIRYQQRSVLRHGDADGPSPDATVVDHKPGHKIFVLAAGPARLMSRYADDFISGAYRSVPPTSGIRRISWDTAGALPGLRTAASSITALRPVLMGSRGASVRSSFGGMSRTKSGRVWMCRTSRGRKRRITSHRNMHRVMRPSPGINRSSCTPMGRAGFSPQRDWQTALCQHTTKAWRLQLAIHFIQTSKAIRQKCERSGRTTVSPLLPMTASPTS